MRLALALALSGFLLLAAAVTSYKESMIKGCISCDLLAIQFVVDEKRFYGADFPMAEFNNFESLMGWVEGGRGGDLIATIVLSLLGLVLLGAGALRLKRRRKMLPSNSSH